MKIRAILTLKGRQVLTIQPSASIATLVHRLALERVGALVVSRDSQHLEGIVSERDVVHGLARHEAGLLGADLHVADIMTHHVVTCSPDDTVKELMQVMTQRRIRHMPVIDQGVLAGMISIGDLVKSRIEEVELEASVLRDAYIASH